MINLKNITPALAKKPELARLDSPITPSDKNKLLTELGKTDPAKTNPSTTKPKVDVSEGPAKLGSINEKLTAHDYARRDAKATSLSDLEAKIRTSFSKFDRGEDFVVDRGDAKREYMKYLSTELKNNHSNLSVKFDAGDPGAMKVTEHHPKAWNNWRAYDETRTLDLRGASAKLKADPVAVAAQEAVQELRAHGPAGAFKVFQRGGMMEEPEQFSKVVNKFKAKVENDPVLNENYSVDRNYSTLTIRDKHTGRKSPFLLPAHMPMDSD